MNKYKKEVDAIIEEFDRLYIHENLWKSDNEEYAYAPIEGMRQFIFDNLHKMYSEGFKEGKKTAQDAVDDVIDELVAAQQYCEEVNGRSSCKNCGLKFERLIASLSKEEESL